MDCRSLKTCGPENAPFANPQSWDLYLYRHNNPPAKVDPDGPPASRVSMSRNLLKVNTGAGANEGFFSSKDR
jgi:hypothetical protein